MASLARIRLARARPVPYSWRTRLCRRLPFLSGCSTFLGLWAGPFWSGYGGRVWTGCRASLASRTSAGRAEADRWLGAAFGGRLRTAFRSSMPPRVCFQIGFVFLALCGCLAQDATLAASASEYVKAEVERQHIPGLSLLVARGGKIVLARGFGLANVELQVPVKPETIFQSGSVGKQFTATAVMMLVEEGKVRLDDPLRNISRTHRTVGRG